MPLGELGLPIFRRFAKHFSFSSAILLYGCGVRRYSSPSSGGRTMLLIASLSLITTLAILVMAMATMMATREETLATVLPYSPGTVAPSEDTVGGEQSVVQTVLVGQSEWQIATLSNLTAVEDLLDSLEAHGIEHREVTCLADNIFAVRWK
jgi:hypothetical protein